MENLRQLTDEMILDKLNPNPAFIIIVGLVVIGVGFLLFFLLRNAPKIKNSKAKYLIIVPFAIMGLICFIIGFPKLFGKKATTEDFVVIQSEVVSKYKKKNPGDALKPDATADHRYFIRCRGIDEDIRITQYMYFNKFEEGDELFIVIELQKGTTAPDLIYKADEYEYVGERLKNSY
ncbi:MAG: hypothetical protein MSR67_00090 [Oscillospiraceae bacterium]|nr:hypothetical protein [Oscillospiraceae bacterium]